MELILLIQSLLISSKYLQTDLSTSMREENESMREEQLETNKSSYASPQKSRKSSPQDKKVYVSKSKSQYLDESTLSFRKKMSTVKIEEEPETIILSKKQNRTGINQKQKFVWRKKKEVETQKIMKVSQITGKQEKVNIQGQIIFIWTKAELINYKKLPSKHYQMVQLYDGTGTIIVYIAINYLYEKQLVRNGENIKILRGKLKSCPKEKPELLCDFETKIEKSSENFEFQLQKFALTVKQLLEEPVGSVRNVMGLVIQARNNVELVEKTDGNELHLSKIKVFDPEQNCEVEVKLWEDKTRLRFYNSIYIFRGIEIKEYKSKREYSAVKDFTYRALEYSKIEHFLRPTFEEREILLRNRPIKTSMRTIARIHTLFQQNPSQKILWSIIQCNIKEVVYDHNYETFKYSLCSIFQNKVMISANKNKCFFCLKNHTEQKHQSHYAIKIQFKDCSSSFYGQCHDEAIMKLFSENDQHQETIPLEVFEMIPMESKKFMAEKLQGDMIHGLFATIKEEFGEHEMLNHYLIDLVPIPNSDNEKKQTQ